MRYSLFIHKLKYHLAQSSPMYWHMGEDSFLLATRRLAKAKPLPAKSKTNSQQATRIATEGYVPKSMSDTVGTTDDVR